MTSDWWICATLAVSILIVNRLNRWMQKQRQQTEERVMQLEQNLRSALASVWEEAEPIETRWLIKAPNSWGRIQEVDLFWDGSFTTRDCYLVVVDRNLTLWVGFIMPETIESLMKAGYCHNAEMRVPICGNKRQAFAGPNVEINQRLFTIYPRWFSQDTPPEEWSRWAELEDTFNSLHYDETYPSFKLLTDEEAWKKNIAKKAERDAIRREALYPPKI